MSVSYFFVAFDNEEKEKENGKEKESSSRRRRVFVAVLCCIVWCFGWVGDGSELDKRESLLVWRNI